MGRELKRVPLDFNWPINKVWGGYINPFYQQSIKCPHCEGSGSSPEARLLKDKWYGNAPFKPEDRGSKPFTPDHPYVRKMAERNVSHAPEYYGNGEAPVRYEAKRLCDHFNSGWMHHLNADDVAALVEAGRLKDFTHTWKQGEGWKPKDPPYIPTPEEVNTWSIPGFGHDSINAWVCISAECKRLGCPEECSHCKGEGSLWPSPEIKKQADDWERSEPPQGEGYQLWETVSEGSPISPVFFNPEDLADWLANSEEYQWKENDKGTTKEQWLRFINGPGWAPSLISDGTGVMTGVQGLQSKN